MKRASTIVGRAPCVSKNSCARSRYSVLKIRASGCEQPRAEAPADPVADLRADDRGDEARRSSTHGEVEVRIVAAGLGRGEEPGDEQQRVARQRRRDEARLDEDHEHEADRPEGLDQLFRVEEARGPRAWAVTIDAATRRWPDRHVLTAPRRAWQDGRRRHRYGDPADRPAQRTTEPSRSTGAHVAKSLVIVESPAKGKTIAGYLGADDYTVMASVGHIRDLPSDKKELQAESPEKVETHGRLAGIDPNDHFDVVYVVHPSKKKVVTELKRALKGADELILATDEDREGEAIGWHVLEGARPEGPGEADGVPRDHAARDPRGARTPARARHEARRGARGPPHPRPARRVGDVADPVASVRARAGRVRGPRPERRGADGRRARAGADGDSAPAQWHDLEGTFLAANADANAQPFGAALVDVTVDGSPKVATSTPRPASSRADRDVVLLDAAGATASPTGCATSPSASRASTPTRSPNDRARRSRPRRCSRRPAASCGSPRRARWRSRSGSTSRATSRTCGPTARTCRSRRSPRRAARSGSSTATTTCPQDARAYRSKVKNAQEAHEAIRPAGDQIRSPEAVRGRARR